MRSAGRIAIVSGATATVLAACGGSSTPPASATAGGSSSTSSAVAACPASAGLTGAVDDRGTAAGGSTSAIAVEDSYFEPTCVTGVPPGTVTLTMKNTGASLHNISVPEQGLDTDLPTGQTVTVHITVGATPVHYFCKYHRTSGMQAALLPAGR